MKIIWLVDVDTMFYIRSIIVYFHINSVILRGTTHIIILTHIINIMTLLCISSKYEHFLYRLLAIRGQMGAISPVISNV